MMSCNSVSRAADRERLPTGVDMLPDELLTKLIKRTGVKNRLASLPHNSRLHRARRTAVEGLSIRNSTIHEADIQLMKKYINLERLNLSNISAAGIPAWQVVWELSCLQKLMDLSVTSSGTASSILPVVYTANLHSRLQSLDLDQDSALTFSDLASLAAMTSLRALSLTCSEIETPESKAEMSKLRIMCAALQSLRELSIHQHANTLEPGLAAVFPGSLTGLTSLELTCGHSWDADEEDIAVVAAISGLVNLEELNTNYHMLSPQVKQQALAQLTRLSTLTLTEVESPADAPQQLLPLPQHSMLQELYAQEVLVHDPFVLRLLRQLKALGVGVPEARRGAVLQGWPLQELTLNIDTTRVAQDAELHWFPTAPSLTTFHMGQLAPSGGLARYLHLASMLHRHAGHLQDIVLHLTAPYLEPFPAALPACRKLRLLGGAVGTGTLALLRSCSLPALQELELALWGQQGVTAEDVAATVQQDLGWLTDLPGLQKVKLMTPSTVPLELQVVLVGLLPGKEGQVTTGTSGTAVVIA